MCDELQEIRKTIPTDIDEHFKQVEFERRQLNCFLDNNDIFGNSYEEMKWSKSVLEKLRNSFRYKYRVLQRKSNNQYKVKLFDQTISRVRFYILSINHQIRFLHRKRYGCISIINNNACDVTNFRKSQSSIDNLVSNLYGMFETSVENLTDDILFARKINSRFDLDELTEQCILFLKLHVEDASYESSVENVIKNYLRINEAWNAYKVTLLHECTKRNLRQNNPSILKSIIKSYYSSRFRFARFVKIAMAVMKFVHKLKSKLKTLRKKNSSHKFEDCNNTASEYACKTVAVTSTVQQSLSRNNKKRTIQHIISQRGVQTNVNYLRRFRYVLLWTRVMYHYKVSKEINGIMKCNGKSLPANELHSLKLIATDVWFSDI